MKRPPPFATAPNRRLTRRSLLTATAAVACMASGSRLALNLSPQHHHREVLVSALKSVPDQFGIGVIDKDRLSTHAIAFRGHSIITHALKSNCLLAFPRRPGDTCLEVNLGTDEVSQAFTCNQQRHLFGHGCFSADGQVLFTTEANLKTGYGVIGVRDAKTYQLLTEFPSGGIGPHDIKLMSGGQSLAVANGGILTHPQSGRKKLNLDSMHSSLTLVDTNNGSLEDIWLPTESKASARHIDVAADGTIAIALQVQRSAMSHDGVVPLAAVLKPDTSVTPLAEPVPVITAMNDYAGSVAINDKTRIAGFTSPRGNLAAFWNIDSGGFVTHYVLHDVCGIAISADSKFFIVSNSHGAVRYLDGASMQEDKSMRQHYAAVHWDNHLTAITV